MADTKQATPDFEKIALEMFQNCVLRGEDEEIWHDVAKGAAILKKHWLASRSGPDRTLSAKEFFRNDPRFRNTNTEPYTDVELAHVNTSINGTDVFEFAEAYASQAGPDRGQQDAPGVEVDGIGRFSIMLKKGETLTDIADELAHVAEQAVMPPLETHVEALQITMKFAADKLRQFMAKAARDGQDATQMLLRIRATLQSRAEGHNTGGDIEVMKAVDAIVRREARWEGEPWEAPKGKST